MRNKPLLVVGIALAVLFGAGLLVALLALGAGSFLVIASSTGTQPTPVVISEEQPLSVPLITLERTACFGTCPIYTLSIYADGRVEYEGRDFVEVKGSQTSSITPELVDELLAGFDRADYVNLESEYNAPVTDLPTTITSLTLNGETKTVRNYGGCMTDSPAPAPQALCDLEIQIDQLTNSAQWVGAR